MALVSNGDMMDKQEVVGFMTDVVVEWNKKMAADQNVDIEPWLKEAMPQLKYANELLYDALSQRGIIK
jgi:hypothetical protein